MVIFLTVLITLVSLLLIFGILMKKSRGGGLDSTMWGGATQMFGVARSSDFIEKATWFLIAALFILCILTAATLSGGTVDPAAAPGTEIPLQSQ